MYEKFIFVIKIMIIKFEGIILAREVRGRALNYFPGGTYKQGISFFEYTLLGIN